MDILDFGKYNFYIWLSYTITFLVLILNVWLPLLAKQKILKNIRRKIYLNKNE